MGVHKPRTFKVEISTDNQTFTLAEEREYSDNEIFKEGNFIEDLSIKTKDVVARYIRFTLETPGKCPEDHVRPGQASRIYLDEIIIK